MEGQEVMAKTRGAFYRPCLRINLLQRPLVKIQTRPERHQCHAANTPTSLGIQTDHFVVEAKRDNDVLHAVAGETVAGTKNRNGEAEVEVEETCDGESRKLCQADLPAAGRFNIRSVTTEEEGVGLGALAVALTQKNRKVDEAYGSSRLKLPARKRKNDLTDCGPCGVGGRSQKKSRVVPLGDAPQPRKRTKQAIHSLHTVLHTKHIKQSKLKRASGSLDCHGKKQEVKESHGKAGTASQERRCNSQEQNTMTSTADGRVSMEDFGKCSQSKTKRRKRKSSKKKAGEAFRTTDVNQSRDKSVLCAACSSKTWKGGMASQKPGATVNVNGASRSKSQRRSRKQQKVSKREYSNNYVASAIDDIDTENANQGWAVIRDTLRSQTELADTSLHADVDSNAFQKLSKRETDKHRDSGSSSRWERRYKPRKTDYLEPGESLSPRQLLRPDSTYHDFVAGEMVLVNNIIDDPCKWEAVDESELVACQDGNTPQGYRDASGGICRLYREYLDIVNGEVLRQVAIELWEYVSYM
uniref:Uncharacterized protein n=1 Tax=Branchiostoma floridae TaxID=7739 RepID=C3YI48_BRAFL|eukprot:XP_002604174.1 hypothetical protein BRAFLDRAFT_73483 [Branchiostoma floridae]